MVAASLKHRQGVQSAVYRHWWLAESRSRGRRTVCHYPFLFWGVVQATIGAPNFNFGPAGVSRCIMDEDVLDCGEGSSVISAEYPSFNMLASDDRTRLS